MFKRKLFLLGLVMFLLVVLLILSSPMGLEIQNLVGHLVWSG